jgi:hypothetical protein
MQFFLSFVLSWGLLGTLAAIVFSSAGPCYFGAVTGMPDPFAGLMDYLRAANLHVPVWSLHVQDMLWRDYLQAGTGPGSGISAMPSMHVATAVLFALLGWRVSRALGIALTGFAALIMIGSVHLGWHYAIDGYAGAAGADVIWKAVGWALARERSIREADMRLPAPAPAHG